MWMAKQKGEKFVVFGGKSHSQDKWKEFLEQAKKELDLEDFQLYIDEAKELRNRERFHVKLYDKVK